VFVSGREDKEGVGAGWDNTEVEALEEVVNCVDTIQDKDVSDIRDGLVFDIYPERKTIRISDDNDDGDFIVQFRLKITDDGCQVVNRQSQDNTPDTIAFLNKFLLLGQRLGEQMRDERGYLAPFYVEGAVCEIVQECLNS